MTKCWVCCALLLHSSKHAGTASNRIHKGACEAVMVIQVHPVTRHTGGIAYLAFGEAEHAFANDVELNLGCPTSDGSRTRAQKAELPGTVLHRPG